MTQDEIIIYGFNLGNSDPKFQEFVHSLTSYDVHNLRKILYDQKYKASKNNVGAAMWGRDRDGIVAVPYAAKKRMWKESDDELFDFIKNIWVATELGYSDPDMNPIKLHQWKVTRTRAVTTRKEGWDVIISTAIEVGVAYVLARSLINIKQTLKTTQTILKRDYFKIHSRISNPGQYGAYRFGSGQLDVGHRSATFFSDEVLKTGNIGFKNYKTIYFNKTIGDKPFSIGVNPWKRTIFHEGPGVFK